MSTRSSAGRSCRPLLYAGAFGEDRILWTIDRWKKVLHWMAENNGDERNIDASWFVVEGYKISLPIFLQDVCF